MMNPAQLQSPATALRTYTPLFLSLTRLSFDHIGLYLQALWARVLEEQERPGCKYFPQFVACFLLYMAFLCPIENLPLYNQIYQSLLLCHPGFVPCLDETSSYPNYIFF